MYAADFIFRLAEQQYLNPPPQRCPICGSIDISAEGRCLHCNSKSKLEDIKND